MTDLLTDLSTEQGKDLRTRLTDGRTDGLYEVVTLIDEWQLRNARKKGHPHGLD